MSKRKVSRKTDPCRSNVGPCPRCGKVPTWFNDVPLRAYCWGTEQDPHLELSRLVTGSAQPYADIKKESFWQTGGSGYRTYRGTLLDVSSEGVKR